MTSKIKGTEGIEFPDATVQGSAAYDKTAADARYVNIAGDQMAGSLVIDNVNVPLGLQSGFGQDFVNMFFHVPTAAKAFGAGIMIDGNYHIGTTNGSGQEFQSVWSVDNNGNVFNRGEITMSEPAAGVNGKAVNFRAPGFGQVGAIFGVHSPGEYTAVNIVSQSSSFIFKNDGNASAPGAWVPGSDIRWKDNIAVIPNALDKVSSIRGATYSRNDLGNRRMAGVIAQEVIEVLPEGVVTVNDEGYLGVDPMAVVALLVEAVKELTARVAELEAR